MGASGSKKELTAESHPHHLLQDFHDHHIAKKTPTPGFCCTCGAPPPAEKPPIDEFKTLIFALSNAPGCANLKGREAAQLVTEDNVHHLAFMVIERAAATERSEDRTTLATFLDAIDSLQPIPFAISKTSGLVMKAIDHLSEYATCSPTADDVKNRRTLANLGDFAGKLLAKLDHHAAAPFTERLPAMLEKACKDGRLLTVVPLVCNIMQHISSIGIGDDDVLGMLKEIVELPTIRLQLEFDIVRLFKQLDINIETLRTTGRVRSSLGG
ncbi:unnamed protein product [Vitrella brassicaformis CCMP3155]|uniref:CCR4-NOT transcription complex subunit 1 CAF1-binding domain-containing protein n=1 Tax=Vitrella brassicaformis (strain CCMP3155) TaxID=1169540 RepID=A0A0G4GY91_VITBC|nr:unnamed protein product [Vitrella brassicaformis CCMP3155]|eukprot:CEM36035.1 unnamed protein product [Vitrella brassicaformis CCMP3155]